MNAPSAQVHLVGAGPGDVELMTLKAVRVLGEADVVLVDDLVNPEVLRFARADALVTHVGKRGGQPSTPQHVIIDLMLAHVRAGKRVARLKGGDPFVFGRGGEEMQALQRAGVRVEVVSGITAGIAAPAAVGVPVTHRGQAMGVVFVTGHGAGNAADTGDGAGREPDWAALAATGMTLVVYMGMRRIGHIVDALLAVGLAPDTPAVAIASATRPEQRHLRAPLRDLPDAVRAAALGAPAIVVIGSVAGLAIESALDYAAFAR
ncbi:uroporphyrinogen-III C-methyltransferase [Caballeronia ptereochthonis]|uniref:uroporphyrinogen-III C-methyltransferase n=1 Tax=Caballeronia ptereochthonis TaxID=1777144 RepID=A0A157ZPC4_9BURK|nr:uroporphyrinogen-III C-methyltransferase [Caballeronia ptereochthonis]SAK47368.1 uroporphyrin-III C-methyltransferase [Caballeronia ptereochthonis]